MEDDVFKEYFSKEDFAEEELSLDNSKESVVKGIVSKEDFSKATSKEEFSKDALAESRSSKAITLTDFYCLMIKQRVPIYILNFI